jgi:hypothetical protein
VKKSLLILALVGCMIMSLSLVTMASNVYVEGFGGGTWKNDINNQDGDLDLGFAVGGEYNFLDRYKINLEYLSSTQEEADNGHDLDYDSYTVKFGYRVVQSDAFNLDVTLGYYDESYDDNADTEIDGVLIGADLSYLFNPKFSISGSLGYSVDGSIDAKGKSYDGNDADILAFKIQGNYHFTDKYSGYVGYRYVSSDIDSYDKITNYGPTFGAIFNF